MKKMAFVFPGQGSQSVGMGQSLAESSEKAAQLIHQADETLRFSLSKVMFDGPHEELTLTYNAQPALLTVSTALLLELKDRGIQPDFVAGHSLGEYSALVAAGAIKFEDAVFLVRKRGELMEKAVPAGKGAMAAVMGLDATALKAITDSVTEQGDAVQLANLNSPGQIVISGSKEGVERASQEAKEKGARRVIPLNVSGPFHSMLMEPAAKEFASVLDGIDISDAAIPVIANVTAKPVHKSNEIKELLVSQLYSPVLWEDSIRFLITEGVDTFIEIGPGNVLAGLIKKIDRSVTVYSVSDSDSLIKTIDELKGGDK